MDQVKAKLEELITSILSNFKGLKLDNIDINISDSIVHVKTSYKRVNKNVAIIGSVLVGDIKDYFKNNNTILGYQIYINDISHGLAGIDNKEILEIYGYIKMPNYYFLKSYPIYNYFNVLPTEMIRLIIIRLNRLELITFINAVYSDYNDTIFEEVIYDLDKSKYQMIKDIKTKMVNITWKDMYLLSYKSLINDWTEDFYNRYLFRLGYPKLYDELIKYETLSVIDTTDVQFYLDVQNIGFNWKDFIYRIKDLDPSKILYTFHILVKDDLTEEELYNFPNNKGKHIDIIKLLNLLQEYDVDFSSIPADFYYSDTIYEIFTTTNTVYKDVLTQIVQFLYNDQGFTNGLMYIYDVNLFKWFQDQAKPGLYEIINTYGSISYNDFDLDDLEDVWTDQYIDASDEAKKKMSLTVDFIASDNPHFSKQRFYDIIKTKTIDD